MDKPRRSKFHFNKLFLKATAFVVLAVFSVNTCYGLAPLPASQNPVVKREILAALRRTQIRYAESKEALELLAANNASCLLLSSGMYLVEKKVADDSLELLRAINHEDVEALLQIVAREDRDAYRTIARMVQDLFPYYTPSDAPSPDLYVNHILAQAFEWLLLLKDGVILENEIPEEEMAFLKTIEPGIMSINHVFVKHGFWDPMKRGKKLQEARNKGMRFYPVAGGRGVSSSGIPVPSKPIDRRDIRPDAEREETANLIDMIKRVHEIQGMEDRETGGPFRIRDDGSVELYWSGGTVTPGAVSGGARYQAPLVEFSPQEWHTHITRRFNAKVQRSYENRRKKERALLMQGFSLGMFSNKYRKVFHESSGPIDDADTNKPSMMDVANFVSHGKDMIAITTQKRTIILTKAWDEVFDGRSVSEIPPDEYAESKYNTMKDISPLAYMMVHGLIVASVEENWPEEARYDLVEAMSKRALVRIIRYLAKNRLIKRLPQTGLCYSRDNWIDVLTLIGINVDIFDHEDNYSHSFYQAKTGIGKELLETHVEEIKKDIGYENAVTARILSGSVSSTDTPRGHPAHAFGNMPEGNFTLTQYCQATGVPRSTARHDFNMLEKLGAVEIERPGKGKSNVIRCVVPGNLKPHVLEILKTYQNKNDAPRVEAEILDGLYDTGAASVLLMDILQDRLQEEDKTYIIEYDELLSPAQKDIIEEYVNLLNRQSKAEFKTREISRNKGSKKSLINVYCKDKKGERIGEGHVDVRVPEGELEEYILRITGMVNIAIAAATIPRTATKEELQTTYGPLIGFIKKQGRIIAENDIDIPDSFEDIPLEKILEKIQNIILIIPKAYRRDLNEIIEYNKLARKALIAA